MLKHGKMEKNMLENLKMISLMEKEPLHILMDQNILENGKMERDTEMEL